jgi:WD40 repeat protein
MRVTFLFISWAQVDLGGHTKAVSCLSSEPSGNRIVTGSLDYNMKLYDFGGMDRLVPITLRYIYMTIECT